MKISIIVPIYNSEKYLEHCVDSILSQNVTNFELLLINDGSSDNSGSICNQYALLDKRVKVFHKDNEGVSSARNVGLDNAEGEWIVFVDSDDWISDDYLNIINVVNHNKDIHIIYFGTIALNYKNEAVANKSPILGVWKGIDSLSYNLSRGVCNHFIRNSLIQDYQIRFSENIALNEDKEFNLKCILHSNLYCISLNKYFYRFNPESASKSKIPYHKALSILDVAKNIFDYIQKSNIDIHKIKNIDYLIFPIKYFILHLVDSNVSNSIIRKDINDFLDYIQEYNIRSSKKLAVKMFLINPNILLNLISMMKNTRNFIRKI